MSALGLVTQNSHHEIAVTTVATSGFATILLQGSQDVPLADRKKKEAIASDFWVTLQISGGLQQPRLQVAAARYRSCSDHRTRRPWVPAGWRFVRESAPGLIRHVLTVLLVWSGVLLLPRLPAFTRSLKLCT